MADWLKDYYSDVDNMRLDDYVDQHTEDVSIRFGGTPAVHGKEEVRQSVEHFWGMIKGLKHNFVEVHTDGDTTILEAEIDYIRLDGDTVTVPCASVLHRTGDLVDRVKIYIDLAPVFAPAE